MKKLRRGRSKIERLWYFRVFLEQLRNRPQRYLSREDVARLIRFYLDGSLDWKIRRDFREWLKANHYL